MCRKEHLSKMKVRLWDKLWKVFKQNENVFMGQVANSV